MKGGGGGNGAVFEHLTDDRRTLSAVGRVSRSWAALALDVLWRARRPKSAFAGVASPARRAVYAAKVRTLVVWRYNEVLRSQAFPLLRTLRLIPYGASGLARTGPCDYCPKCFLHRRPHPFHALRQAEA